MSARSESLLGWGLLALARRAHRVMPRARVVGLGVAPEALPCVLVRTSGAHVGAGTAVGEAAAVVRTAAVRAGRTIIARHCDLLTIVAFDCFVHRAFSSFTHEREVAELPYDKRLLLSYGHRTCNYQLFDSFLPSNSW